MARHLEYQMSVRMLIYGCCQGYI